jgi:hypothetical protein
LSPASLNGQHSTDDLVSTNWRVKSTNVIPFGNENALGVVMDTQYPVSDQFARTPKDKHVPPPHIGPVVCHQHMVAILDKGQHAAAGNGNKALSSALAP